FNVTINGDTKLEADESFSVSLSNVSPTNANISASSIDATDTATRTIQNDDSATLTVENVSQAEGDSSTSTMTFTVTLDHAVQGRFTVPYSTANGTATTAYVDYVSANGTLPSFPTRRSSELFNVTINGDTKLEADESFSVSLSNVVPNNANIS